MALLSPLLTFGAGGSILELNSPCWNQPSLSGNPSANPRWQSKALGSSYKEESDCVYLLLSSLHRCFVDLEMATVGLFHQGNRWNATSTNLHTVPMEPIEVTWRAVWWHPSLSLLELL